MRHSAAVLGSVLVEIPWDQLPSVVLGKDRPPAFDDLKNCIRNRNSRLEHRLVLKLPYGLDLQIGPG